jgi:DnaJ-class molecular chaperone
MTSMKSLKSGEPSTEVRCSACGGTGFPTVAQPAQTGRRIYPLPCKQCSGKGRVKPA